MPPRFYAPDIHAAGDAAALPDEEAAHLTRVLRLGAGATIHVFDGSGHECVALVESVRPAVRVRATAAAAAVAEPRVTLELAQAVLKSDGMDAVVRDAVMLGVSRIQPVVTTRTEVALAALRRSRRVARWQRVALASAKQCGRAVLPVIAEPVALDAYLHAAAGGRRVVLVEPGAAPAAHASGPAVLGREPAPASATLLVGPEGGWTGDELEATRKAGWTPLTLGPRTLRADAAAVVAITCVWTVWGEI